MISGLSTYKTLTCDASTSEDFGRYFERATCCA